MRKWIFVAVGYFLIMAGFFAFPKIAEHLKPIIIEKEIPFPVVKEVIVEKPIFKGERIVEKIVEVEKPVFKGEKIVYKPLVVDNFIISQKYGDYTIEFTDGNWQVGQDGQKLILKRVR